jgi:hypothetical protein
MDPELRRMKESMGEKGIRHGSDRSTEPRASKRQFTRALGLIQKGTPPDPFEQM